MKIALLGYGKEGQAAEKYFSKLGAEFEILTDFDPKEIAKRDFSEFDLVLRSPSVHPFPGATSLTRYFFEKCPCPIIGVTATKGKGTTCSFIKSLLDALGEKAFLVGNIGEPAINALDDLTPDSVVVYEMSSFQLWDLERSPAVAVVGTIEPDHLNVHDGFDDYISAKANIGRHQSPSDTLVYFANNPDTKRIADQSPARKLTYPTADIPDDVLDAVVIPGKHNRENAMAAILAVSAFYKKDVKDFVAENREKIMAGLSAFHGLPHRLEFLREVGNVLYYDDNFSTNPASTKVAIAAFPEQDVVVIVGGRDKTDNEDIPEIYEVISTAPNIRKIVLMGESGHELARRYQNDKFIVVESLEEAVNAARTEAEKLATAERKSVVLMSPTAASFDMFKDVYDRGDQYKTLVNRI